MSALLIFHLLTFPWPFWDNLVNCENSKFVWCTDSLRAPNLYFYYVSYALVFGIALPCLNNSLQSIYSLVLGNTRQGTMQGINQAVGSLSRIFGPILMSSSFSYFGPIANWSVEIAILALFLGIWLVTYKRLVPAEEPGFDDEKLSSTNSALKFEEVSTETESIN
jgi:MFS family permease